MSLCGSCYHQWTDMCGLSRMGLQRKRCRSCVQVCYACSGRGKVMELSGDDARREMCDECDGKGFIK